jgi:uncharacterized cupredoxin-like copper-binding protein
MRPLRALALFGVVAAVAACSGGASATPAGPTSAVNAALSDWKIDLGGATGKAGPITFTVTNNGANTHEFVIVKTDTKADALPVASDLVDESAFEPVDEIEDIEPGSGPHTLTVDLAAGHYVILCNIESHYEKGMHTDLVVQ